MTARHNYDVVIVGAGIAGTGLAYFLARRGLGRVLVVEGEKHAAYHASGRSASTLVELDGNPTVQHLKALGGAFLRNPPAGFSTHRIVNPIGALMLFREPGWEGIKSLAPVFEQSGVRVCVLDRAEACRRLGGAGGSSGVLCEQSFDGAAFLPEDGVIDVHELLSSYMRHAREAGVTFAFETRVEGVLNQAGSSRGLHLCGGDGRSFEVGAGLVVNAAGAWAGRLASMAGAGEVLMQPLRRSLVMLPTPPSLPPAGLAAWPLVWSDPHGIYFRPESGGLLFCPMDEEPMDPCDAGPDETAILEGLERLRALAPALVPSRLGRRWGGLRTFAPDRVPVVGEDPEREGFFWLAGQGGSGIETSPVLGRVAADLIETGTSEAFDIGLLAPGRFAPAA